MQFFFLNFCSFDSSYHSSCAIMDYWFSELKRDSSLYKNYRHKNILFVKIRSNSFSSKCRFLLNLNTSFWNVTINVCIFMWTNLRFINWAFEHLQQQWLSWDVYDFLQESKKSGIKHSCPNMGKNKKQSFPSDLWKSIFFLL